MGARSGLRGPLGSLGRLAGGVWGVFGDFWVVLGGFAAVFGGFGAAWGDFWPILSLRTTPREGEREAKVLIPDSAGGALKLCLQQIYAACCHPFHTPCARHRRGRRMTESSFQLIGVASVDF